MDFTCNPRPFLQDIRSPLLGSQLLVLGQQLPGLLGLDAERDPVPSEEHGDREQQREPEQGAEALVEDDPANLRGQDAEQQAGEASLQGQCLGRGYQGGGREGDHAVPAASRRRAQAPGRGHGAKGDRQSRPACRRGAARELGQAPHRHPDADHRVRDDLRPGPAPHLGQGAEGEQPDDHQADRSDAPERDARHLPIMAVRDQADRHDRSRWCRCTWRGRSAVP
jgi:hypothetical protein